MEKEKRLDSDKCPLCGKPLAGEEFKKAYEKLKNEVEKETVKQLKTSEEDWKVKFETLKKQHDEDVKHNNENLKEGFESTQKQTKEFYEKLLKDTLANFDSLKKTSEAQLKENFEQQLKNKESELKKSNENLKNVQKEIAKRAVELAKEETAKLEQKITERELELKRAKELTEDLQNKLSQSSSELKGEAGELNLYSKLSDAFPDDRLTTKKKGKAVGDIIHHIRMKNGKIIGIPIVYDNKVSEHISRTDYQKANKYKSVHKTKYVIIVSSNLPKEIKNGVYGEKNGVLLAAPSVIVDIAKQLREAIIDIYRTSGSNTDRDTKEAKLYEYIRSQEFLGIISKLSKISEELNGLQQGEEFSHQTLWKRRKEVEERLKNAYTNLASEIESILAEQSGVTATELIEEKEMPVLKKGRKKIAASAA